MKLMNYIYSLIASVVVLQANETLTLSQAYEMALQNEPKLKALVLKTESTEESVEQSRAKLFPQLNGNVSWGKYQYQYVDSNSKVDEDYLSYSISMSQPIFHPELWRGIDEAQARQAAARYDLLYKSQQLGVDVTKAYFTLLWTSYNVELLKSEKEYHESRYKQLEEQLKMGLANKVDTLEAKILKDKTTAESLAEEKKFFVARMRLKNLIKSDVGDFPKLNFSSINISALFKERPYWEERLSSSPTVKSTMMTKEMAQHQLAIHQYEHLPKLDMSLNRKNTSTQDRISHEYDNQIVLQMSIPIYSGGYTESKVREAVLVNESAQYELEAAELDSKFRFEELWADYELASESLQVLLESEKSGKMFLESVEKSHAAGLKTMIDVLEAKAKLYKIQRDIVDAGFTLVNDYVGLLALCGELNQDNILVLESMMVAKE